MVTSPRALDLSRGGGGAEMFLSAAPRLIVRDGVTRQPAIAAVLVTDTHVLAIRCQRGSVHLIRHR